MTKFRPCIDLHQGKVKQIVGESLSAGEIGLVTNYISNRSASDYAKLYSSDDLKGGHLIMLGAGNNAAALSALQEFPKGLQVGGGITQDNALDWIEHGASHVIVTSCLFDCNGKFLLNKLKDLVEQIGKENIVIDLSCKRVEKSWRVMKDNWQMGTDLLVSEELLEKLSDYCSEFLIHAINFEGKCKGIDEDLVKFLGKYCPLPSTYAGGVSGIDDLDKVKFFSANRVDLSIGSGLDIFGGELVKYKDCVSWNNSN